MEICLLIDILKFSSKYVILWPIYKGCLIKALLALIFIMEMIERNYGRLIESENNAFQET